MNVVLNMAHFVRQGFEVCHVQTIQRTIFLIDVSRIFLTAAFFPTFGSSRIHGSFLISTSTYALVAPLMLSALRSSDLQNNLGGVVHSPHLFIYGRGVHY